MNNIKSYESIAREAGYCVLGDYVHRFYWFKIVSEQPVKIVSSDHVYPTERDAWAACVHENNLVEE